MVDDKSLESALKREIKEISKWLDSTPIMHPDYMANRQRLNEKKIRLQAVQDRIKHKGAGIYLPNIEGPSNPNY